MEPARARAILARAPGLTARHLKSATATATPAAMAPELLPALLAQPLPRRTRDWLSCPDPHLVDSDLRLIEEHGYQILCALDAGYPPALAASPAPPATLYVRGNPAALTRPALAVMGTARPTAAGAETARRFAAELGGAGLSILSALAEGIDTAAQEGALGVAAAGIAVCASGLDRIRPARSAQLEQRIRAGGCVISLCPPGTPPRRYQFPVRNRLIAALATAILVIEADAGSGAWRVVTQARSLRRRIFAVPGSIRDPHSRVCNDLIRGGATLVQQSSDLLDDLNLRNIQSVVKPPTLSGTPRPLDNKYEMLLDAAGFEPVDIDMLTQRTGLPAHAVASMLLLLELQGRVAPQPGGWYCRLS